MSWNVHAMVGTDRRADPERIARVIGDVAPDVAGCRMWDPSRRGIPPIRRERSAPSPG